MSFVRHCCNHKVPGQREEAQRALLMPYGRRGVDKGRHRVVVIALRAVAVILELRIQLRVGGDSHATHPRRLVSWPDP